VSLWSEQIRVGFCADRIVWVRVSGGLRRRILEKLQLDVESPAGSPTWSGALEALQTKLTASVPKRTRVSVVLSNRLVRYMVVPWHSALMARSERLAQARHCFREAYGDMANDWEIAMAAGSYGQPALASAIDRSLLTGLREICQGWSLQSVQPYLTSAYRQFRRDIRRPKASATYFGVVEPDELALIRLDSGGLAAVSSSRTGSDWQQTLRGMLLQGAMEESVVPKVRVLAPGRTPLNPVMGAQLTRLELPAMSGYSPLSDERMNMAIVGLT